MTYPANSEINLFKTAAGFLPVMLEKREYCFKCYVSG